MQKVQYFLNRVFVINIIYILLIVLIFLSIFLISIIIYHINYLKKDKSKNTIDSNNISNDTITEPIKNNTLGGHTISLEFIKTLLNSFNSSIYVTDPITNKILFMNDKMKNLYQLTNTNTDNLYLNSLHNSESNFCDFCEKINLLKLDTDVVTYQGYCKTLKNYYKNITSSILWINNKQVYLHQKIELKNNKETNNLLLHHSKQQKLIATLSQIFTSSESLEDIMNTCLKLTGEFLNNNRILFIKNLDKSLYLSAEWHNLKSTNFSIKNTIVDLLDCHSDIVEKLKNYEAKYLILDCLDTHKSIFNAYNSNASTALVLPVYNDKILYGLLYFDRTIPNFSWDSSDIDLALTVSHIFCELVKKKSLEEKLAIALNDSKLSFNVKSDFLSKMSHEIRTPLNAICGLLSIAKNSDNITERDYCIKQIDVASMQLLSLVNDILDASKLEANKLELHNTEFSLKHMLQTICSIMEFKIIEKKQDFTLDIDHFVPTYILSDELRINQVITNLLSNAIKFTPEGKKIVLRVRAQLKENNIVTLNFNVIDEGIGINPENLPNIFEPFFQAHQGVQYGGTGLGLAICKNIINLMGGNIFVNSKINVGSDFGFTIDAICINKEEIKVEEKTKQQAVHHHNFKGHKILLVEDILINQEIIVALLRNTNIIIDTANDGSEAIKKIQLNLEEYSLILMDIQLPHFNGYEITTQIRNLNTFKALTIPIISLSANITPEDIKKCLDIGMNDCIFKPIDTHDLVNKISTYIHTTNNLTYLPHINIEDSLNRFNNNDKLLFQLLKEFDFSILEELSQVLLENNKEKIINLNHKTLGVAGNMGLPNLYDICSKISKEISNTSDFTNYSILVQDEINILKKHLGILVRLGEKI